MKLTKRVRALCEIFAKGRVTVSAECGPPETGFEPRYFPKVAGRCIAPTGMPNQGYRDRAEAMRGGAEYKRACRYALRPDPFAL